MLVFFYWWGTIWDRSKLQVVQLLLNVEQILLLPINSNKADLIQWDSAPDGAFHVRLTWEIVRCSRQKDEIFFFL